MKRLYWLTVRQEQNNKLVWKIMRNVFTFVRANWKLKMIMSSLQKFLIGPEEEE